MKKNIARILGGAAAATALLAATTGTASAQEIPTVGCNFDVVTLGLEQVCINVYGQGLFVDRVTGELEKVSSSPDPIEGAEVNLFGILANGAPYDVTTVAPDGISSATAEFAPRAEFQDGSQLCVRAKVGVTEYSDPACIQIQA